jgi:hypothetical protein
MKKKTILTEYNYYKSCRNRSLKGTFGMASFACCTLMIQEFYNMLERKAVDEDRRFIRKHVEGFFK